MEHRVNIAITHHHYANIVIVSTIAWQHLAQSCIVPKYSLTYPLAWPLTHLATFVYLDCRKKADGGEHHQAQTVYLCFLIINPAKSQETHIIKPQDLHTSSYRPLWGHRTLTHTHTHTHTVTVTVTVVFTAHAWLQNTWLHTYAHTNSQFLTWPCLHCWVIQSTEERLLSSGSQCQF